jgi:hypothetical protein
MWRCCIITEKFSKISYLYFSPKIQNYSEIKHLPELCNNAGFTFLNRADAAGPDNADAAKELEEVEDLAFLDTPLGYRKAFGKAAAQGLAVTELKPADEKATQEVEELFQAVFEGSSRKAGKVKSRVMEAV